VLPSGQKLTLGLMATITLEVVPFPTYALFSAPLVIFKCMLEVMFCEAVQHSLQFCLSPQLWQNGRLSVLSAIRETDKST
jgi:hypothetical protein